MRPFVVVGVAAGGLLVADRLLRGAFADAPAGAGEHVREFAGQVDALVAELGALPGGRPKLSARTAVAWIEEWMGRWAAAHEDDRDRYRVLAVRWNPMVNMEPPAGAWRARELRAWLWSGSPRSALGVAWDTLRALHPLARNVSEGAADAPWVNAALVGDAIKHLAVELDAAAAVDEPSMLGAVARRALANHRRGMEFVGEGVGWVVGNTLGHIVPNLAAGAAAAVTSLLPYVVVAGVGYVVFRKVAG